MASTVALIALGALAFLVIGGFVLRRAGGLLILVALLGQAFLPTAQIAVSLMLLFAGVVMWLAGHWHFAWRHGAYKSVVAEAIFVRVPWLDPTRDRAVPVVIRAEASPADAVHRPSTTTGSLWTAPLDLEDVRRSVPASPEPAVDDVLVADPPRQPPVTYDRRRRPWPRRLRGDHS